MTNNMQNGAPHGRRELDRDRDSGRRLEAIGAGRSSNAASMNLGRDPVPSELFRARSFEDSRREWLRRVQRAADLFSDEEILALSEDGAVQLVERLVVEPLVLLETEAYIEDHGSTRASVLVVPFTGDPDLFELDPRPLGSRSGPGYMPGPLGSVTEDALHLELTNTPGLSLGDQVVDTRLAPVRNHVESLRSALERFQADLRDVGLRALEHRRIGMAQPSRLETKEASEMSQPHQKVVQHLGEAHASEIGLVSAHRSQIAITPRGSYRDGLGWHLDEARAHASRVQERLGELGQGRNPRPAVVGFTETLISQSKARFGLLRGLSSEEKVLKNAKQACATEALEIATYTVLERLAILARDERTAKLAASIRSDEERMLERTMRELPKLTDAVVKAELDRDQAARALADRVCQALLRRAKERQPNHSVALHQRAAALRAVARGRRAATQGRRRVRAGAH
jgi:ferritin-like metal-binding protein YciE